MVRWMILMSFLTMGLQPAETKKAAAGAMTVAGPSFTTDGQLKYPADYREWVFLTSGMDMSYTPQATAGAKTVFDNVFVNPEAYRVFLKTGTWPDGSIFVLENRGGVGNHSINTRGRTQGEDVVGMEVHVKDYLHVKGGWAFYSFENKVSAKLIERPASCYTCHEGHAAVDTTFVQFYPTLMPVAKEKGVLSATFLKDEATAKDSVPAAAK